MNNQFIARCAATVALIAGVSSQPAAQQLCPIDTNCPTPPPNHASFHETTQVFTDSTLNPDLIPFNNGNPQFLSVPKFDKDAAAALHPEASGDITLVGVELELEISVLEIFVQATSNFGGDCEFQWTDSISASIDPIPALNVPGLSIPQINVGQVGTLPAFGSYEWRLTRDGNPPGAITASDCLDLTTRLDAWVATGGDNTATFQVRSSASYAFDTFGCGNNTNGAQNSGFGKVSVVYHYCYNVETNQPPVCDAGASQSVECRGFSTQVMLDGSGSFDPDNTALNYSWTVDCPGAYFVDPTSIAPTLIIDATQVGCDFDCTASLQVTDAAGRSSQCETVISVVDTLPPKLFCPPEIEVDCDKLDPEYTGIPNVQDSCDVDPTLSYVDEVLFEEQCAALQFYQLIRRTWTATDDCGNSSYCTQELSVLRLSRDADAVPGSCPNLFRNEECPDDPEEICVGGPAKPSVLSMVYTGDDCSASVTEQDAGAWDCSGDPNDEPVVRILATNKINGGNIHTWFDGEVALGATYEIDSANAGMTWLQANVHIRTYDLDGNLLQHTYFHSSCSEPLAVGDQFGAHLIVGFVDSEGNSGGGAGGGGQGELEDLIFTIPGSAGFDVTDIDLASLKLFGEQCTNGGIAPTFAALGDVTGPSNAPPCGPCANPGPDQISDLSLTFDRQAVIDALGLAGLPQGERVELYLTGLLNDGCPFISIDCIFMDNCEPSGGGESVCTGEGPPNILYLTYTGEDCSATVHNQEPEQVSCSGDPASAPTVHVVAQMPVGGQWVWFDADVNLGETFTVDAANAGQSNLKSKIWIRVYDMGGGLLQEVEFHTSCSQPLNVGDQYGSLHVTGFVND